VQSQIISDPPFGRSARSIVRGYAAACRKSGKSRVQIWRDVRRGLFPAPIQLGPNSVAWFEDEIDDWLASRERVIYAPQLSAPTSAIRGVGDRQ